MKIARFLYKKKQYWGKINKNWIICLKESPFKKINLSKKKVPLDKVKLLAPTNPTKIILVGLNYRDHAKELKMKIPREPIIFLKPPSSIIGHLEKIIYPKGVKRLDYEAELAIVVKRKAKKISRDEAKKYILGFTCLNDVTARDLQSKDVQWSRAKSFDTFCPLGPWIETCLDIANLEIKSLLNGKLKQRSCTSNFIFPLDFLVSFISKIMTLTPGDIISTGTPHGVGPMKRGDKIEIVIEGIGSLVNKVA